MKNLKNAFLLFSFLMVITSGCQKDPVSTITEITPPVTAEESSLLAEQTFNDINTFSDNYMKESGLKSQPLEPCPSVTWNLSALPFSLSFDWGTGCTGTDNLSRKGKITVSLTGKMDVANSIATFAFDNYYTQGYKLTGVHKLTYVGFLAGTSHPKYYVFTEARIDFPNGKFMTYRSESFRILAEGASTVALEDDVWRTEGTSRGVTADGVSWTARVNSALVKSAGCRWISKGIMLITPKDLPEFKVDFGEGTCDNKATVTKNDKTYTIEMK